MFTGIIERMGIITDIREVSGGRLLRIDVGPIASDCKPGASVCVSGVCLTVTRIDSQQLEFDVIAETLRKSTLGQKKTGHKVNLERSLRASDRLDGHFVQGHVDGLGIVQRVEQSPQEHIVWITPDASLKPYIVPKGSVTIDGVSLTIAEVTPQAFSVALIPTTLDLTTFGALKVGDSVNLESDIIARTVVHRLAQLGQGGSLTMETLKQAGMA